MSYINGLNLIGSLLSEEQINSKRLLAEVDFRKIELVLKKSKAGLPHPFLCSDEPKEDENFAKLPIRIKLQLQNIYTSIENHPRKFKRVLPKLLKLQIKYPNVPAIYNYIAIAYQKDGQAEKHYQAIIDTIEKFPDYLFGKAALAEYYLVNERHKEIPAIFDNKLEIYFHAQGPEFHVSEVRSFYAIMCKYYIKSNRMARAIFSYSIVNEVDPDHPLTQNLADEIVLLELSKLRKKMNSYS